MRATHYPVAEAAALLVITTYSSISSSVVGLAGASEAILKWGHGNSLTSSESIFALLILSYVIANNYQNRNTGNVFFHRSFNVHHNLGTCQNLLNGQNWTQIDGVM